MTNCLTDKSANSLAVQDETNWLTSQKLIDWLVNWLTDSLSDWLSHELTDEVINWLTDELSMTNCLADQLSHRLIDWLTNKLMAHLTDWLPEK